MKKIILLFLCIFLNAKSLDELILKSQNNELINIKQNQTLVQTLEKEKTTSKYMPKISIEGGYLRTDLTKFMTDPNYNINAGFVVDLLIYDGGAREANLDMLESSKTLANLDLKDSKNKLAYEISMLYFTYNSLATLLEYKKQYSNYLKNSYEMVEKLNQAGLKPFDELKVLEANYQLALTDEKEYEIKLNEVLLNLQKLTKQDNIFLANDSTLEEIDDTSNSLLLQMLSTKIDIAKTKVKSSKSHHFPTIFLQNKTIYHINDYGIDMPHIPIPQVVQMLERVAEENFKKRAWHNTFMIGFKYDLFSFGANSKQTQIDKINLLSLQNQLEFEKRALRLDNENIKSNLINLKEQINANKLRVEASSLAFKSVNEKYNAGLISYVEYLNALELKFKANAAYELAKSKYEIAKARYYYINGIDILDKVR